MATDPTTFEDTLITPTPGGTLLEDLSGYPDETADDTASNPLRLVPDHVGETPPAPEVRPGLLGTTARKVGAVALATVVMAGLGLGFVKASSSKAGSPAGKGNGTEQVVNLPDGPVIIDPSNPNVALADITHDLNVLNSAIKDGDQEAIAKASQILFNDPNPTGLLGNLQNASDIVAGKLTLRVGFGGGDPNGQLGTVLTMEINGQDVVQKVIFGLDTNASGQYFVTDIVDR